jgi:phenylpropionate dioxygenase-like ring-hydroxylating dioxygenase large terminal subunit
MARSASSFARIYHKSSKARIERRQCDIVCLSFTHVHFQIRAFSNVCRHHAARVCEGEGQVMSRAMTTEYVF